MSNFQEETPSKRVKLESENESIAFLGQPNESKVGLPPLTRIKLEAPPENKWNTHSNELDGAKEANSPLEMVKLETKNGSVTYSRQQIDVEESPSSDCPKVKLTDPQQTVVDMACR